MRDDNLLNLMARANIALDELNHYIKHFAEEGSFDRFFDEQAREFFHSGYKLQHSLYLLLPPRGPSKIITCPRCGEDINLTIS